MIEVTISEGRRVSVVRRTRLLHTTLIALLALAVAALLLGCAGEAGDRSQGGPDISGVVISADTSGDVVSLRVVWIEEMGPRSDFEFDVLQVSADRDMSVADGTTRAAPSLSAADLSVGDLVAVSIDGPVAESYPPQGAAKSITYLGVYEGELPEVPGLTAPGGAE